MRTSRRLLHGIVAVLITMTAALPTSLCAQEAAGIAMGAKAPGAAVQSLDGTAIDLRTFMNGKPVVLEFWATWCPLCKQLEPAMQAARTRYANEVRFVGVGVSTNQSAERQRDFIAQRQMTGDYVFDNAGAAVAAYKVPHTSYVVVIDATGTVVYTGVGGTQDIDAAVRTALRGRADSRGMH